MNEKVVYWICFTRVTTEGWTKYRVATNFVVWYPFIYLFFCGVLETYSSINSGRGKSSHWYTGPAKCFPGWETSDSFPSKCFVACFCFEVEKWGKYKEPESGMRECGFGGLQQEGVCLPPLRCAAPRTATGSCKGVATSDPVIMTRVLFRLE